MEEIRVGLLGLGTVGSGVYNILKSHQEQITRQVGCPIVISKVLVRNVDKKRPIDIPEQMLTTEISEILMSPEIDVIVEVMGGLEKGKETIELALQHKKHVVTANKDVIAQYGSALLKLAKEQNCDLFFEASVAGGIPIIRSITDGLASDHITKVLGIVNGTTNYILTKMTQENKSYGEALKAAQDLGFAEADPTSDVEGIDAARKMVILASLAFSMGIELEDVYTKGISQITAADIAYTKQLGYTIKLLGLASRTEEGVEVSVQPTLLSNTHPLASVSNEFNAVSVYGDAVGETMFYGPGAGSMPTATSIVSDLIAVAKNMRMGISGQAIGALYNEKALKGEAHIYSKYFMRIRVKDEIGVFALITDIFAKNGLSLESILQLPVTGTKEAEIILITHKIALSNYVSALKMLKASTSIVSIDSCYRVEQ